jgi:hypothetical protein
MTAKTKSKINKLTLFNAEGNKEDFVLKEGINRNVYLKKDSFWIRNPNGIGSIPQDINNMYSEIEIRKNIENEIYNSKLNIPNIETETFEWENVIIVSNGYGFKNDHADLLDGFPNSRKSIVISVNNTPRFWESKRLPNYYITNNLNDFSNFKFLPILIAGKRSDPVSIVKYKNMKYFYSHTPSNNFKSPSDTNSLLYIDDYRNPICAAISCCNHYKVKNLILAFCSEGYENKKDGMEYISDNVYMYPQQKLANSIINGMLFWYLVNNPQSKIFYTGLKNSFSLAKYIDNTDFKGIYSYGK